MYFSIPFLHFHHCLTIIIPNKGRKTFICLLMISKQTFSGVNIHKKNICVGLILTCSQAQGTSVYLDQQPGNVSAGTPRTSPAAPGHPGWHGRRAAPASRGTAGTRCTPGSPISQCAGTGGGSRNTSGGNRRWVVGSGSGADWAGTVGTPPGARPIAAPGWRRRGTGRRWSRCWPRPRTRLWRRLPHLPQPRPEGLLLLLFLLQKLLILQPLLLWGPVTNYRAADPPHHI